MRLFGSTPIGDNSQKVASTTFIWGTFAPLVSPALTGTPTSPTAVVTDNTTTIANTSFVQAVIANAATTFATLASPAFTGAPTAPTASLGDNTTKIATTAFVKANSISTASPAFTGIPTAPTASIGTSSIQIATTAFVLANAISATNTSLNGTPTCPTAASGNNSSQIANTAYVVNNFAPLISANLTGTPTCPTAASGNNSSQIANTAYVVNNFAPLASPSLTGIPTAPTVSVTTNSSQIATTAFVQALAVQLTGSLYSIYAPIASPSLTGTPQAPTASANTNNTQIATTAFVLGQCATVLPLMNGTATVGTTTYLARQDHIHPSDTSRAPIASPTFTGTVTVPGLICKSSLGITATSGGITCAVSTTSDASLTIPSGVAPTTPNLGDIWYDSTQQSLTVAEGSTTNLVSERLSGVIWTKTTTTTLSSWTSAATILGAASTGVGTLTIPANFLIPGKTFRIKLSGLLGTASAAPTLNMSLILGGTSICSTGAVSLTTGSMSSRGWEAEFRLTCRSTGSSGSVMGGGKLSWSNTATLYSSAFASTLTAATVNTTNSLALDVQAACGTSNASNTISCNIALVEVLN